MSRLYLCCLALWLLTMICLTSAASVAAETELRRVEVPQSPLVSEVTCDIGDLIAARQVEPREAIGTEAGHRGTWVLRSPASPPALRWPRNLLHAGPDAPELVIDPQLQGAYDVVAIVRAVDGGGAAGSKGTAADPLPMAFELALDDGSQREIVGAKGFPDRHFDTEVLAGCGWRMNGGTPKDQNRKVDDADLGYPTSIQLADGSIFTVCYHNTAGSNCFIAGTFWQLPGAKDIR